MSNYGSSELILNPDGTIFHLKLQPDQIPETVILVGDPGRVFLAGSLLQHSETLASNREFTSLTGFFNGQKILVLSTGIGPDNMDIVINELDALVNIDFPSRSEKQVKRKLKLIRIGTSGAMQANIPVGSRVASAWSIGLDGLMNYYLRPVNSVREKIEEDINLYLRRFPGFPSVYAAGSGDQLLTLFKDECISGITVAAHGFYGPQGRELRSQLAFPELNEHLSNYRYDSLRINNFEMESSALYGLSEILGHEAMTICLIIANRAKQEYLGDYKLAMEQLIEYVLQTLTHNWHHGNQT